MANPRRNSEQQQQQLQNFISSLKHFLKKPHSLPFLLLFFLLLAWLVLRVQFSYSPSIHHLHDLTSKSQWTQEDDKKANLVRFKSTLLPSPIRRDHRGWLLNPVSLALDSALPGGAVSCASVHLGEILPGGLRGNHRHHGCNETFVIWGAKTLFRLENLQGGDEGYAEVIVGADEVAVATSPMGTAHALVNVDAVHTTFFIGCQDSMINYNTTTSDFNVWKDLS